MKKDTIILILVAAVLLLTVFVLWGGHRVMFMGFSGGEWGHGMMWHDRDLKDTDDGFGPSHMYEEIGEHGAEEFQAKLEAIVIAEIGQPIEGIFPQMLLQAFPGLEASDFDGVDAMIGHYEYVNGELIHDLEDADLIHSAAEAITDAGYETLLVNVAERTGAMMHDDVDDIIKDIEGSDGGPVSDGPVACTMDAKECPDGSFVGRVGPDCAFAACPMMGDTEVICTPEMHAVDVCTEEYQPVCGLVQVECITTPCDPVPETFSNGCFACANDRVLSYTSGACAL